MTSFACKFNVSRASQAVNWRVKNPVDDATNKTSNAPRALRRSAQQPRAGQFWFLPPYDCIPADSRIKELESHRPTYGHPIIVKAIVGEFAEFCTVRRSPIEPATRALTPAAGYLFPRDATLGKGIEHTAGRPQAVPLHSKLAAARRRRSLGAPGRLCVPPTLQRLIAAEAIICCTRQAPVHRTQVLDRVHAHQRLSHPRVVGYHHQP